MVKEDRYIENRFGEVQPFKASQDYLDNFADQFTAQLPDRAVKAVKIQHAILSRVRLAMIATASVLAIATAVTVYFAKPLASQREQAFTTNQQTESNLNDGSVEGTAFYSMVDNGDIYAMLADE